jgi:DNA polymerase III sliding clamp (beta) subunit (PCNA family)
MSGEPLDVCVDASVLLDRCRSLEGEKLSIKPLADAIELRADGKRRFTVTTQSGSNFPAVETAPVGSWGRVAGGDLLALIAKTAHAICDDDTRPVLNSLYLEQDGSKFRAVTTSGTALATAEIESAALDGDIMLPARAVHAIKRMLTDAEVSIATKANRLFLRCGTSTFSCNTVQGAFVPYRQVMPRDGHKLDVQTSKFLAAVKALSGAADAGVLLEFGKKSLELKAAGAEDELDIAWAGKAKPCSVKLNCTALANALTALASCDSVEVTLQDDPDGAPAMFSAGGSIQLVMPMVK